MAPVGANGFPNKWAPPAYRWGARITVERSRFSKRAMSLTVAARLEKASAVIRPRARVGDADGVSAAPHEYAATGASLPPEAADQVWITV